MANVVKVEKVEEIVRLNKDREAETYFRTWATSPKGVYFHLDLPDKIAGTPKALEVLAKRAAELDSML